ncbi:hypothetical protein BANRA_05567 [Klebsiella pneumoniae]|nr:hypothetical protein BANRA_05567 [Klebsiella pneumoniae]
MFNTDSLAWKWHSGAGPQIYPWVSWLYRGITVWPGFPLSACFSVWLGGRMRFGAES